ncbi:DUF2231 domain-containing protein [Streptomyces naganishii]|uniref:DUF2231 domain-containing protein n=1 Tax=Streptomyces naganishii JCM 4654 TaxID=1306179 RepID=A0A918Y5M1_9ACTN|nr:DUF2231 domain-containing protein [Streptomyces naganishii]GHD90708.1 hypothetical protein GCM10010508_36360 [Streptomyces naganishii JCM 4654]
MSLINGLPAHVLLVHVVVVLVPLTALALVICSLWPQGARRLGLVLPILALVTLVSVPLATQAGEWLERHVDSDPLVRRHAELGDGMLPWAVGLFVLAAGVWWLARRTPAPETAGPRSGSAPEAAGPRSGPGPVIRVAAVVLSVAVAAGAVVTVYRIGDSGAKAAWHDAYSKTATKGGDD